MVRVSKQSDQKDIRNHQHLPISSLDHLGKSIFETLPEIKSQHPQVVKQYYQTFLKDYHKDNHYTHTEKIDDITYQRLDWLKDRKCGYYHDIIERAVLMAYVMYRAQERPD